MTNSIATGFLVLGLLLAGCGDPKNAAGALDPSKMNRRPPSESKVAPSVAPVAKPVDLDAKVESKMGDGSVVPAPAQ